MIILLISLIAALIYLVMKISNDIDPIDFFSLIQLIILAGAVVDATLGILEILSSLPLSTVSPTNIITLITYYVYSVISLIIATGCPEPLFFNPRVSLMGPGLKNHVLLNAPVMALLVTTTIMAIGLAVVAWYWFLVPNGSVEVLGQPALVRKGDYYEAYVAVRNSGRDAVVVYGLEVEGGKCIIETGNNIKPASHWSSRPVAA